MGDLVILNDKERVKTCILYEFLNEKPIFSAYKSVCATLGENAIDYLEFEHWYMRFSQGNYGMDYEYKKDEARLELVDLPVSIFGKIAKTVGFGHRFVLREVCKSIKNAVDQVYPTFDSICIQNCHDPSKLLVQYNHDWFYYQKDVDDENKCTVSGRKGVNDVLYTSEHHYGHTALTDMKSVISHPNMNLKMFSLDSWTRGIRKRASNLASNVSEFLRRSNLKINAKQVILSFQGTKKDIAIVNCFEAETMSISATKIGARSFEEIVQVLHESHAIQKLEIKVHLKNAEIESYKRWIRRVGARNSGNGHQQLLLPRHFSEDYFEVNFSARGVEFVRK
ncbi:hypothetical protein B9Z55_029042 [Caenorhabditis nigoni]|uniref:Mos1 transposase HTH domain-containing protein n=1 Tax=Caenorhabditis nigoni TaxID=1611254 RepID=A0A2G5S8X0_9PELO|nr:hypothetical protein B9Z55_029042 [Caenorhabditis nigoni]